MEIFLMFVKVFAVGGGICAIAQLLINLTKLTAGRILVIFLLYAAVAAILCKIRVIKKRNISHNNNF